MSKSYIRSGVFTLDDEEFFIDGTVSDNGTITVLPSNTREILFNYKHLPIKTAQELTKHLKDTVVTDRAGNKYKIFCTASYVRVRLDLICARRSKVVLTMQFVPDTVKVIEAIKITVKKELGEGTNYPIQGLDDIACVYCNKRGATVYHKKRQLTITDGKGNSHYTNVEGFECTNCDTRKLSVDDHYRVQNTYGLDYLTLWEKDIKVDKLDNWVILSKTMKVIPFKDLDHRLKKVNGK